MEPTSRILSLSGLRPFFPFYGSKWQLARRYPPPEYGTIVEPFAGAAGYAIQYPGLHVHLLEADPVIAGTWQYLIAARESEIRALPLEMRDGLPQEAKWLIGWWLNKGGATPAKMPGKWMRENRDHNLYWGERARDRIASGLRFIRHWKITCAHYSFAPRIEATWFIDPPYQVMGRHYRFGSDLLDYAELADWCRGQRGQVMVCEGAGADWLPFTPLTEREALYLC